MPQLLQKGNVIILCQQETVFLPRFKNVQEVPSFAGAFTIRAAE